MAENYRLDYTGEEVNNLLEKINNVPSDTEIQLNNKANKAEVLTKTNITSYTPTANYHPATKKYVDDANSVETYTFNIPAGTASTSFNFVRTFTEGEEMWIYFCAKSKAGTPSFYAYLYDENNTMVDIGQALVTSDSRFLTRLYKCYFGNGMIASESCHADYYSDNYHMMPVSFSYKTTKITITGGNSEKGYTFASGSYIKIIIKK